jgi:hypothetical protein
MTQNTVWNDEVWVCGGLYTLKVRPNRITVQLSSSDRVDIYLIKENRWVEGPPLPGRWNGGPIERFESSIYLLGGDNIKGEPLGHVFYINLADQESGWQRAPAMPAPRYHAASAVWNGYIYVLGGADAVNHNIDTPTIQRLDPRTQAWELLEDEIPQERSHTEAATFTYGDEIISLGGRMGGRAGSSEAYAYNPATGAWRLLGHLPDVRESPNVARIGGAWHMFGGGWRRLEQQQHWVIAASAVLSDATTPSSMQEKSTTAGGDTTTKLPPTTTSATERPATTTTAATTAATTPVATTTQLPTTADDLSVQPPSLSETTVLLRLNVGGATFVDADTGHVWISDEERPDLWEAAAGSTFAFVRTPAESAPVAFARRALWFMYNSHRDTNKPACDLRYILPAEAEGTYSVRLHLAETYRSSANKRDFGILVGKEVVADGLDVIVAAGGPNAALVLSSTPVALAAGTSLEVSFVCGNKRKPMLSGLEFVRHAPADGAVSTTLGLVETTKGAPVTTAGPTFTTTTNPPTTTNLATTTNPATTATTPNPPTTMQTTVSTAGATVTTDETPASGDGFLPIRVNAGGMDYVDSSGRLWRKDYGYNQGLLYDNNVDIVADAADPELLRTERYSAEHPKNDLPPLQYSFAVPVGRYRLNLYLAEICPCAAGDGDRQFDVEVEGTTIWTNLDVYAEAGGFAIALVKTTEVHVTDGALDIVFHKLKGRNRPKVGAIEILAAAD